MKSIAPVVRVAPESIPADTDCAADLTDRPHVTAGSQGDRRSRGAAQPIATALVACFSIIYGLWATAFIYRSSVVGIDGKRYFCLFDDAMISMRYAWNFSTGHGLVWNRGEHVQGYTNLLMTLVMSAFTYLFDKSTAVLAVQALGVWFVLVSAWLAARITGHVMAPSNRCYSAAKVATFALVLLYYPLSFWSLMGMETGLLTVLVLSGTVLALESVRDNAPGRLLLMAVSFGLAFLTRNESVVVFGIVCLYVIACSVSEGRARAWRMYFFAVLCIYGCVVVGQLAFQLHAYGDIVPNTYTLKLTGMSLLDRMKDGVRYLRPFFVETRIVLALAIIGLVFSVTREKLLLIGIFFSLVGYQVYVGGDAWNYWRMTTPAMPLILSLFAVAACSLVVALPSSAAFGRSTLRRRAIAPRFLPQVLVGIVAVLGATSLDARFQPELTLRSKPYLGDGNEVMVNTAIALKEVLGDDATVGVYWAGAIPYYSGFAAIDFLGKSDPYIARLPPDMSWNVSWYGMRSVPGHNKYDLEYSIAKLLPTYVQGFKWGSQDLRAWGREKYVTTTFKGVTLNLRKDSSAVRWDRLLPESVSTVRTIADVGSR